jgi:RHS repeat-associated protein
MQTAASDRTSTWAPGFPAPEPHFFGIEWNAEKQLKRVLKNAVEQARFAYDPLGRRVERVAGGTTTLWTYQGEDILRETAGGTGTKYVHGPGTDEPLAQEDGAGVLNHLHADALGSVMRTSNAAGSVIGSRRYEPFGTLELDATSGYAFTGREWDAAMSMAYYRARYYDPMIGRFISEDPSGFAAGINFYRYVRNNPATLTDPQGLDSPGPPGWSDPKNWKVPAVPGNFDPAITIWNYRELCYSLQNNNFPGVRDPYFGGFRHCVCACLLERQFWPLGGVAVSIWDLNEDPTSKDSQGDMRAEKKGLFCGGRPGTCEEECLREFPPRAQGGNP